MAISLGLVEMRRQLLFVSLLVTAILYLDVRDTAAQETKARDLSRYEDGGTVDLSWDRGGAELEGSRSKLRNFLWEHWSQHRLGRIVSTIYSLEGDPTTISFYVEPDENGAWRVATEYERYCCWFYGMEGKERKRETGKGTYYIVERVVGGRDAKAKEFRIVWSVIPAKEKRRSGTYALRLRGASRNQKDISGEVPFIL